MPGINTASGAGSSINNIHGRASDSQAPLQQQNALLNELVSVENQPQENPFDRLLPEMMSKIAFSLDAESYGNFRATCKDFATRLPGFPEISDVLKQEGVKGDTREKYLDMLSDRKIRNIFKTDNKIASALRNCHAVPESPLNEFTLAGTYSASGNLNSLDFVFSLLFPCVEDINKSGVPALVNPFRWSENSQKRVVSEIILKNSIINPDALNVIFSSLDKTYRTTNGPERFIIARLADSLKNYWAENLPGSVTWDDIATLRAAHPELFKTADNVAVVMNDFAKRV